MDSDINSAMVDMEYCLMTTPLLYATTKSLSIFGTKATLRCVLNILKIVLFLTLSEEKGIVKRIIYSELKYKYFNQAKQYLEKEDEEIITMPWNGKIFVLIIMI